MVRSAVQKDKVSWDAFVDSCPTGSFLQTWAWGDVQEGIGLRVIRLIQEESGEIVSVAQIVVRPLPFGFCWLYIPRGPVRKDGAALSPAMEAAIFEQATLTRAAFIRIDPAVSELSLSGKWRKAKQEVQPKQTRIIDLTLSEEELLNQMHSKTRYNVRLAERKGVSVRFSRDRADLELFLQLAADVKNRSGFSYHPGAYYHAILEQYPQAELALAEHGGEVLAVHLMIYAAKTATYAHGASSDTRRNLMAPQYLYWQTMRRAKEKECTRYDVYGVAPEGAGKSHPWAGITRIKSRLGGQYVEYMGAFDAPTSASIYIVFQLGRSIRNILKLVIR